MVFHAELGSQGQRVQRLVALAGVLVPFVPGAIATLAERAAMLAKADLVTGMVGEFPELQGIMGGHYARVQGEPAAVAVAVAEHYSPKGPDDRCPTAPVSVVVALADKLDMLVGFFARRHQPDRLERPVRAATGRARRHPADPRERVAAAAAAKCSPMRPLAASAWPAIRPELLAFFVDRLKVYLREKGVRHDLVAAVFALGDDDLVRLLARTEALAAFLRSEDGRNLLVAYRRASNIVGIEEKRDGRSYTGASAGGSAGRAGRAGAIRSCSRPPIGQIAMRWPKRGFFRRDAGAGGTARAGGCLLCPRPRQCRR